MPLGAKTRPIGVDVDADQIHYCQGHLPSLGEYICIPHEPPMPFADGTFDCIYSISTFTHFTEPWQHHWLKELKRIAQPNALLILSIAGERNLQYLSTEQKAELNRAGFVCSLGAARGDHSPDYYHLAMHTYDYVRQVWSTYFEILDIVPAAINNNQAAVVCRVA
jgi:SAM-dependent methyltransferase